MDVTDGYLYESQLQIKIRIKSNLRSAQLLGLYKPRNLENNNLYYAFLNSLSIQKSKESNLILSHCGLFFSSFNQQTK